MDAAAPFGRWPSPLNADGAAAGKVSLSEVCSDGTAVYWLESRPLEGGRVVFVRGEAGALVDLSPPGVSIRSQVHEYGGGACRLVPGHGSGAFAYVDAADQRVWLSEGEPGGSVVPLSPPPPEGERWAHGGLGASADGDWVVAVRERHDERDPHAAPRRCVVALGARPENRGESILAEGHDFYGAPRLHPANSRLAGTVWDPPDMPWDRSAVVVTPLERRTDPATGVPRLVAAGPPWTVESGSDLSVGQPEWQGDGGLRFVSDRHGWWQPYSHHGQPGGSPAQAWTATAAEFHGPDWALGQTTMAELPDGTLVARVTAEGRDDLVLFRRPGQPAVAVAQPCVAISSLCAHGDGVAYIGAPPDAPATVWTLGPLTAATPTPTRTPAPTTTPTPAALRPQPAPALGPGDVSVGEPFTFTGRSGRRVHGLFYRPTLRGVAGPPDLAPPLVIGCHGGPTGSVGAGFDLTVQFFTSRGFAYVAVDYAGSTGYGRAYRDSLRGAWGVADAEDCVDATLELAARGWVDATRMASRGSSSGGLTALNVLAAGEGVSAAVSWYGVTDLLSLAASTHDFEARYLDRLVGPLPESRAIYEARSPARRAADIKGSVLLLQGLDDRVVPPAQTEQLRDALTAAGRHCEVRFFEGEGHGFRRFDTLRACLEAELDFYLRELRL
jgi:dipeptidyl aminopeptidase/acylaminoacyl peptidase